MLLGNDNGQTKANRQQQQERKGGGFGGKEFFHTCILTQSSANENSAGGKGKKRPGLRPAFHHLDSPVGYQVSVPPECSLQPTEVNEPRRLEVWVPLV